jgi:uncharacterized membrane protein
MKSKKSKKKTRTHSMNHKGMHHEKNARAVAALFVILIAFGIYLLFYTYQDQIIVSGSFKLFMSLVIVGMGFLVGLLFLINKNLRK